MVVSVGSLVSDMSFSLLVDRAVAAGARGEPATATCDLADLRGERRSRGSIHEQLDRSCAARSRRTGATSCTVGWRNLRHAICAGGELAVARRSQRDCVVGRPAVLLIAMPWEFGPSIQLGVLHGLLERHGIAVASRSLFVDAIVHFTRTARVRWADYIHIASRYFEVGLGDWIFAVPPFLDDARDGEYFELLRRTDVPGEMIDKAVRMKRVVPGFLDRCVDQVLDTAPAMVGFTTTFS